MDYGIWGIRLELHSCDDGDLAGGLVDGSEDGMGDSLTGLSSTNFSGSYSFDAVLPGKYYFSLPEVPYYYVLAQVWSGDPANVSAHNAFDLAAGRSECFEV